MLRIQSLGNTGRTLRKASSVYFTVAALMTNSGSNSLISSQSCETIRVVDKTQLMRVDVEHRLVLKTQYVSKKSPFSGSEN